MRKLLPVCLLTGMIYAPIIYSMTKSGYDYLTHMRLAVKMLETGTVIVPHFLFHLSVIVVSLFSAEYVSDATVLVLLLTVMATAAIVALILNKECPNPAMVLLMTTALLIAAPVTILAPFDKHLYLGYISPNVFHNPTILMLKPLALLSFGLILKAFDDRSETPPLVWLACILATIACTLTKPSFTICILPATVLLIIFRILRKDSTDLKLLLFGLIVPALVTLAFQFNMTYGEEQLPGVYSGKSGIIFAPLVVMKAYSSWLFPKFLLSLIFPLAVLLSDYRAAVKDTGIQLGWLAFMTGIAYNYLLAESGPRMFEGNFCWSSQITLFILFVNSARFLFHNQSQPGINPVKAGRKFRLCNAALLLHAACGVLFYLSELIQTERYW